MSKLAMSLIKTQQTIHINSAFRQGGGTDSDFIVNIPLKKNNRFTHVAVIDISVPKSYYLIGEGENTFTIRENQVEPTIIHLVFQTPRQRLKLVK